MKASLWYSIRFLTALWILLTVGLTAQEHNSPMNLEAASYIGARLPRLIDELGVPDSVHSVRGPESWQDDVVFVYDRFDIYIFQDAVWQLALQEAYGLKVGDSRSFVQEKLGEALYQFEDALVYHLRAESWPMRLRVRFDEQDTVDALFIYRSDF